MVVAAQVAEAAEESTTVPQPWLRKKKKNYQQQRPLDVAVPVVVGAAPVKLPTAS